MSLAYRERSAPRTRISSFDSGFVSATRPRHREQSLRPPQSVPVTKLTPHAHTTTHRRSSRRPPPGTPDMQGLKHTHKCAGRRSQLRLSDLDVVQSLGEGGWSKVFLVQPRDESAEDRERRGAVFALKMTEKRTYRDTERNDDREDRAAVAERKNHELRSLTALPWNPFVTGIIDMYTDPRNTYLMLEYAPGGSLHDYMHYHKDISVSTATFYFANIVLGLEFLHTQGIIHRDIKDENILIGADGYLTITDFGLAQYVDEGKDWIRMGTLPFMSYEVVQHNTNSPEARYASDWWSAAVVFFELLADHLPFSGINCDEISKDHELARIRFPEDRSLMPKLKEFFVDVFKCDLKERLGARSEPTGKNGSRQNIQFREHEWLKTLRWDRIESRIELVPFLPGPGSDPTIPTVQWEDPSLPEQRKVPGLRMKRRSTPFEYDDTLHPGDEGPRRKRRRVSSHRNN